MPDDVRTGRIYRLFVEASLKPRERVPLSREQAHYLRHVLRLKDGDHVSAFNGRDGEWLCHLALEGRSDVSLAPLSLERSQPSAGDLHLLFAPLKHARLDYMVQKAVEMGASRLMPVTTRRTQVARLNLDRMRANAIEAAEQCGILALPEVMPLLSLEDALAGIEPQRRLIFCDEGAKQANPVDALMHTPSGPLAVLIGPEGGFATDEREAILRRDTVTRLSLGPRIMRADTAAVAALAIIQACLGDWRTSRSST